ncbi:MAG: SPOR domain-containing protein [Deltaproteobacteria bacterium]|nr:SPOR domain-containing protein [Deltaproteobacteria bacterium]
MAVKKRKKRRFAIRFELGIGGFLGLGLVSFCIFLWMFLLGVWSGQTVLSPSTPGKGPEMLTRMATDLWQQGKSSIQGRAEVQPEEPLEETGSGSREAPAPNVAVADEQSEPSFFSLQVGSFRDNKRAQREVLGWKAKGQDAFFLPPEEGADAYRVFIGKFEKLAEANAVTVRLERDEDVRAYVTLLPAAKLSGLGAQQ